MEMVRHVRYSHQHIIADTHPAALRHGLPCWYPVHYVLSFPVKPNNQTEPSPLDSEAAQLALTHIGMFDLRFKSTPLPAIFAMTISEFIAQIVGNCVYAAAMRANHTVKQSNIPPDLTGYRRKVSGGVMPSIPRIGTALIVVIWPN